MKNITTWRPDTCGCVLQFEWDPEIPADERIHTPIEHIFTCEVHLEIPAEKKTGDSPKEHLFNAVMAENQKKNQVMADLLESKDLAGDVLKEDGSTIKAFKAGRTPDWQFDKNRTLKVVLKGLPKTKVEIIKASVLTKHAGIDIS